MSESESYEEVTVASEGVTVIKTFEADAFPVPAIAFRIQSDRDEPVTVRLVDEVPEDVAVEDLGFHPEYGSEFWTIDDEEITFERELDAEEQYTTVYGIRATGTDNVEQFLTDPNITEVDPPLDDDTDVVGSSSDVVRDVISGDTDSVPGLDEDDEGEDEDIGTLDLADPNEEEQAEADDGSADEDDAEAAEADDADEPEPDDDAEAATDAEDDTEPESADPATNGQLAVDSVASALATEIREDDVAEEDLELLRDELDLGTNGAVDARIEKLQTDVSDLSAYIDALEEFLEENGKGQDVLDDVQEQLDSVQDRIDGFQDTVEENSEQVDSLDDSVSDIGDDVQTLKGDIKDLDDELSEVKDGLSSVDDLEGRLESIDDDIEELKQWREQLSNVLGAADD